MALESIRADPTTPEPAKAMLLRACAFLLHEAKRRLIYDVWAYSLEHGWSRDLLLAQVAQSLDSVLPKQQAV